MSEVDLQGGTTDINSWMLQRIDADKARSFKIERVHPAYQDSMSAIGFLEDIQSPIDERYIQQRWGGGTYTITAQVPGKGRAGKKNLGTLQIDLPGPPLTYPGPDGKPVPFPSAVNAFKVIAEREQAKAKEEEEEEEEDDTDDREDEDEDDRDDDRDSRRYGHSRHNDRRPPPPARRRYEDDRDDHYYRNRHGDEDESMFRRSHYDAPHMNGYGGGGGGYNPAQRLREISNQRQADSASSEALKLVQTTVSSVQDSASRQLDAAREEVTALRETLFKMQGQQNRPYEETLSALRTQSDQQRANFETQMNALRASYEQQIGLMRQNNEHAARLLADRHADEIKMTQAQVEGVRRDADRRIEEVKGLMAAQYQSRIDVLTSERDQERRRVEDERRRADDAYTRASSDVERRISEERKSAGDREAIVRQVMEGREQMQVGL